MNTLTDYEREQLLRIREWRVEAPGAATRTFGRAVGPAAEAVEKLIPSGALRLALDTVQTAAVRTADVRSILRRAQAKDLEALRALPLEVCDRLATRARNRAMLLSGGTGALFGVAGGLGLVADVPSLLLIVFRTIHRIGLCYGEECFSPLARRLPVAVFALASANSMQEKQDALEALEQIEQAYGMAWREGLERAAERELAKSAAILSLNNLARSVGKHLGWRKAAESIPFAGALIGGSVNAWYLYDIAYAARCVFQTRWLRSKYGQVPGLTALPAAGAAAGA